MKVIVGSAVIIVGHAELAGGMGMVKLLLGHPERSRSSGPEQGGKKAEISGAGRACGTVSEQSVIIDSSWPTKDILYIAGANTLFRPSGLLRKLNGSRCQ